MDGSAKAVKKRDQRRKRVGKSRQDSLVIDYIRVKYADIYQEGVQFYESINKNHSTKYDLRKTEEYKAWKANMIGIKESTPESQSATPEPEPRPLQSQPATSDPEPQHVYEDNFQLQIPLMHYEKAVVPCQKTTETYETLYAVENIHYIPVQTKVFQNIKVHLRSSTEESIPFEHGRAAITLHLKPLNYFD